MTIWLPRMRRRSLAHGAAAERSERAGPWRREPGAGQRLLAGGVILFALGLGLGVAAGNQLDDAAPGASDPLRLTGASEHVPIKTAPAEAARGRLAKGVSAGESIPPITVAWSAPSDIPDEIETARYAAGKPRHGRAAAWRRHAVASPVLAETMPKVAIVIDDLGLNRTNAREVIALPAPLTLAFMTYAPGVEQLAGAARAAGHELMVHVPMQPGDPHIDPGPRVLQADLPQGELLARLRWGLSRFSGYVGINNHMGSAFTSDPEGMRVVLEELRARGLLFLDSLTVPQSVGERVAGELGVPHAGRDIFLDNDRDPASIRRQLARVEAIARRGGRAIAIGHPHAETIAVLRDWIPRVRAAGIALVPISALVHTGRHGSDVAALPR